MSILREFTEQCAASLLLVVAISLTACERVPYDGTVWDNPLPDSSYPGPVPIHGTYHSSAMNLNVGYNVVLPPEYDLYPEARFPVVYVLHGGGGDENTFLIANVGLNPPALGYSPNTIAIPTTTLFDSHSPTSRQSWLRSRSLRPYLSAR